jgi:hypothetical protein
MQRPSTPNRSTPPCPCPLLQVAAPRSSVVVRRAAARDTAGAASEQQLTSFTIHGRHVDVTPEVCEALLLAAGGATTTLP